MNFNKIYAFFFLILLVFSLKGMQTRQKLSDNTIKIGLLIQDNKSREAVRATELAIRKANEQGGYKGYKFKLITRSMEGPWGSGSREAVDLIFGEKVLALLGSHDGRNAHLVEQVCAKSHVTFLSALAGDPTLSQAFVPWFFNMVPNDLQQASILIKEIYQTKKCDKVVIVSDHSYDSNSRVKCIQKQIRAQQLKEPVLLTGDSGNLANLLEKIDKLSPQCIILVGTTNFSKEFIPLLRRENKTSIVIGSLFCIDEEIRERFKVNLVTISSGFSAGSKGKAFMADYMRSFGIKPTDVAAYAFDAANVVIEVIRKADAMPGHIKAEMAGIDQEGVTGKIRFDEKGNRIGGAVLVRNGK